MVEILTIAYKCCMIGMILVPLITTVICLFDNKKEYTEVDYFIHYKDDDWYV